MSAPKCNLCRGIYDSCKRVPLLLPNCGHTCCKPCLVRLTQHRGYLCPICRLKQGVSNVDDLYVNHSLLEVIIATSDSPEAEASSAKDATCTRHQGVRLAFWCSTCQTAECGECVVESHPARGHLVARLQEVKVEKRRHVETSLQAVIDDIEKATKDCQEEEIKVDTHNKILEELAQTVMESAVVLVFAATILESQCTDAKEIERQLKKFEKDAFKMLCDIPEDTSGWSCIKDLQAYAKRVDEFKNKVYKKISDKPIMHSQINHEYMKQTIKDVTENCSDLMKQILSNRPDHHLILEKTGGLRAKLQYKETRLHLYCPRKASGDELVTQMKHWSILQSLMTQAEALVFLDLNDGASTEAKRIYLSVTSQHPHGRHLLRLCSGHQKSFLNSPLAIKREGTGTVGLTLAYLKGDEAADGEEPTPTELQKGDVVSISGEDAVHLCVVTEAKPGVTLPCIHLGKVKSGLDTVIKAAGNLTNGNICIRDGGFVLQI